MNNKTNRQLAIEFEKNLTQKEIDIIQSAGVKFDRTTGRTIEQSIKNSVFLQIMYLIKRYKNDAKLIRYCKKTITEKEAFYFNTGNLKIAVLDKELFTELNIFKPAFDLQYNIGENFKFYFNPNEYINVLENLNKEDLIQVIGNIFDTQDWNDGYGRNKEERDIINKIGAACVKYCCVNNNFDLPKI